TDVFHLLVGHRAKLFTPLLPAKNDWWAAATFRISGKSVPTGDPRTKPSGFSTGPTRARAEGPFLQVRALSRALSVKRWGICDTYASRIRGWGEVLDRRGTAGDLCPARARERDSGHFRSRDPRLPRAERSRFEIAAIEDELMALDATV